MSDAERLAAVEKELEWLQKLTETKFELADRALILKETALRREIEDSGARFKSWIALLSLLAAVLGIIVGTWMRK